MSRFLTMYNFHIKQYFKNSYFLWLIITSTLSMLMLRYLGNYSQGNYISNQDIILSGVFGMWSGSVTSAGILHFQRHQGVLVYLVNSPTSTLLNLMALVSAPATFGLLAYPLAYLSAGILNGFRFAALHYSYFFYILLFWFSALAITYVIAELFLLTKNAFVYEELFVTPIMIVSGLFSIHYSFLDKFQLLGNFVPITYPIRLLTKVELLSIQPLLFWFILLIVWLGVAYFIFKLLLFKIRIKNEVEAM